MHTLTIDELDTELSRWGGPIMPFDYWADRANETPDFLVEGMVHAATNTISGKPTVGKTRLAAGIAAAVAKGDRSFCGSRVNDHGPVLVITTDPGESNRWGLRMREHGVSSGMVGIARYNPDDWRQYREHAELARLLVFDNVLGSLGSGSVRDDDAARELTAPLSEIADNGTSVVLIAHSGKNFEAGSGRHTPTGSMGSTVYSAWERLNLHVHDVTEPNTRSLTVRSNDHADRNLTVRADWGRASAEWELLSEKEDTRQRTEETYEARHLLFDQVAADPELRTLSNKSEIGRRLHEADPARFATDRAATQAFRRACDAARGEFVDGAWRKKP